MLGGPNSYGGALLAGDGPGFDTMLDEIQERTVRALVCLESDPFCDALDPARAQAALGHLDLLICIDSTSSLTAQRADIFLPARTNAEMTGSYINNEGRLQEFRPVIDPGLPIRETGAGSHPPREFFQETPGAAPAADWLILAKILERVPNLTELRKTMAKYDDRFSMLSVLAAEATGLRLPVRVALPPAPDRELPRADGSDNQLLLATTAPVGSHWLAHLSAPLAAIEPQPYVCLHPDFAVALGLVAGERARLTTRFGHCRVEVRISEQMINGLVLAPQIWDTALEGLAPGSLHDCRLEKEGRT